MRGLDRSWVRAVAAGVCLAAGFIVIEPAAAENWLPLSQDDMKMISEPNAPQAPAIYLYRQVDRSDASFHETYYERLKILTDEGRKYADIEIPYEKGSEYISDIAARTILPDGTVIPFNGTIYDKLIVSARDKKLMTKTFTLPSAGVGSIIEVKYDKRLPYGWVYDSHWILSRELYTREAKFSLEPNEEFPMRWSWPRGIPGGGVPKKERGKIRLEVHDVPAFATEEFMPPENELKYRVDFVYSADTSDNEKDPKAFWKRFGRREFTQVERFIDYKKALQQAVAQTVQPGDSDDAKLRKLYARAQQIHNTSYDPEKTEEEQKREKQKEAKDVSDVLASGRGNGLQVTWLFLGLARTAGFQADPVLLSTRDRYFFNPGLMNPTLLNSNLVIVKVDGKDLYLDPGIPFTPFGLLPWSETGVTGLRLDKEGGTFVTVPVPGPEDSRIERKAVFNFDRGSLQGTVTVTYTGLEASWRRLTERDEDDTDRRTFLKNDVERFIPTGIEAKLTNQPDWSGSDTPLVAEFDLTVPGWAQLAGKRAVFPSGLFGAAEKHTFEHVARTQPLCFDFPYRLADDVTITLPDGWKVESIPKPKGLDLKGMLYYASAEQQGQTLHLRRRIDLGVVLVAVQAYPTIRNFYQTVRSGDDEQIVMSWNGTATAARK
jgi:Domain of Unknown Function with PDB structure (DUF3857)